MGAIGNLPLLFSTYKSMKFYERALTFSPAEIKEYQSHRLREMVVHAYENVPAYHDKYKNAGIHPDDILSTDDLGLLPIMSRKDLREYFPHGILAKDYKEEDCLLVGTTGSSGVPVQIFREKSEYLSTIARFSPKSLGTYANKDFKSKRVLSIMVRDEDAVEEALIQNLPKFIKKGTTVGDALDDPEKHVELLLKSNPDFIMSYPSVMRNMAAVIEQKGITVPQPKAIALTAEMLDEPTRNQLQRIFPQTEILSIYGATEGTGGIECHAHKGMHISIDSCLEIVDDAYQPLPDGTPGRILMTNLVSKATPIIRYNGLGDVAVKSTESCTCGISLPLLARVEGRMIDSLTLPDDRIVHPFNLTLALQHVEGIRKYQIRQEEVDKVQILIVENMSEVEAPSRFGEGAPQTKDLIKRFRDILGQNVSVTVRAVTDIPRLPGSHKYGTVVSTVSKQRYRPR